MTPFYGMNHILEDEAALFAGKQVLGEDVFVNYWGMMPNEDMQNELLERLMEQAGLMEELEDRRDAFTAHSWNEASKCWSGGIYASCPGKLFERKKRNGL